MWHLPFFSYVGHKQSPRISKNKNTQKCKWEIMLHPIISSYKHITEGTVKRSHLVRDLALLKCMLRTHRIYSLWGSDPLASAASDSPSGRNWGENEGSVIDLPQPSSWSKPFLIFYDIFCLSYVGVGIHPQCKYGSQRTTCWHRVSPCPCGSVAWTWAIKLDISLSHLTRPKAIIFIHVYSYPNGS